MSQAAAPSEQQQLVDSFEQFFRNYYDQEIKQLAQHAPNFNERASLFVEWGDLYRYDPELADDFLNQPEQMTRYAEEALRIYDVPIDVDLGPAHVRVTDTEDMIDRVEISQLDYSHLGEYVAVTGQLHKVTGKKPLLREGAFECQLCGTLTRVPQSRQEVQEPHECQGCERQGPFRLNLEQSEFDDQRKIKFKTPPDEAAQGEGSSTTVYALGDLCDLGGANGLADRAGERCTIFGIRRIDESGLTGGRGDKDPECDTWIDAKAIVFDGDDRSDVNIEEHKEEFMEHANSDDPVALFSESIVPGFYADDDFEIALEAAVAWLFNAYRVDVEEGSVRGDLHMGWIGDPGVGKSTLLSTLAEIAPLCEFRSGTGLSKVGLTAAAVREEFGGKSKWTIEPGILPRANGGHCIIDEVDDVIDEKTKAIHDALEGEQMVKVDKAGLNADLETRTALLASGNPTEGRFNRNDPVAEQIDLDPALISRMDVLLALPDKINEEADRKKADHYLESYDELSRAEVAERRPSEEKPEMDTADREVDIEVLRAWVAYARENVFPTLSEGAKEELRDFYLEVRNLNNDYNSEGEDGEGAIPATPRTLGAGVRLATAFARVELTETVTREHAKRAKKITRSVVGLNFDPQTGKFDAGKTDTGNLDRWQKAKQAIAEVEEGYQGGVPESAAIDTLQNKFDLEESKAEHELEKLKQKGEVYDRGGGEIFTT